MSVEILHDFKIFGFHDASIFELKFNGVDKNKPSERYQWFIVMNGSRHDLNFVKMDGSKRKFTFESTEIMFDMEGKKLYFNYPEEPRGNVSFNVEQK